MKKIKILKTVIAHGAHFKAGSTHEVTSAQADDLIKKGFAEEAKDEPAEEGKKKGKKNEGASGAAATAAIALLCFLSFFFTAPRAHALAGLTGPTTPYVLTNLPTFIVGGAVSNITTQPITLVRGHGFAIYPYFAGTNAATTGTMTFDFALSCTNDNSRFSTTNYLTYIAYANGTAAVLGWTNFPTSLTDNSVQAKLVHIANGSDATNRVFITNIVVSVSTP